MDGVHDLADTQHGVLALDQLRALGLTRAQRRRLVAGGRLRPVAPRVYATTDGEPSFPRHLMTGLLALGPGAVVSHRAAAALHGLVDEATPAFTVPRARRNAVCPFRVHATASLDAAERDVVAGFACTSVVRTILDLAATEMDTVKLEAIVGRAVSAGRCTRAELTEALARRCGRGAAGVLRLGAVLAGDGTERLERRFRAALRRAGLPAPRRVDVPGAPTYRFDGWAVTVTLGPSASDWPAIARAVRAELVAAGWPTGTGARVA